MRVLSKEENFALYGAGAFGNCLRQWRSLAELRAAGVRKPVTMRYAGRSGGGWCQYDVPRGDIPALMDRWVSEGAERSRIFFNESAPNHLSLPMRDALKAEAWNHLGPGALLILKQVMTPNSYSDLRDVLELYPDSAVELSVFSVNVGCSPRRNSIIWEVRNY